MTGVLVALAVVPLLPAALIALLLRKLRRAGRPDCGAERLVAAWVVTHIASALVGLVYPDAPPWLSFAVVIPTLVVGFVFLGVRIRHHPEVLFSPATVARFHRLWRTPVTSTEPRGDVRGGHHTRP